MGNIERDRDREWRDSAGTSAPDAESQSAQITSCEVAAGSNAVSNDENPADPEQREHLMQEFHIVYDGDSYQYDGYRYEELADALGYAKLVRAQFVREDVVEPLVPGAMMALPSAADREVMAALDIHFEGGCYRIDGLRSQDLASAVAHARSR